MGDSPFIDYPGPKLVGLLLADGTVGAVTGPALSLEGACLCAAQATTVLKAQPRSQPERVPLLLAASLPSFVAYGRRN